MKYGISYGSWSKLVLIGVAGILAVAAAPGCASESGSDASEQAGVATNEAALNQGAGAEAFKGIFFGVGVYGDRLPRVWNKDNAPFRAQASYVSLAESVVDAINKKNPSYFPGFEKSVFSKDPVTIDTALANAVAALNYGIAGVPSNVGQDIWKTENVVWKNDVVYETTRVVHGDPADYEDPYARRELAAVIAQTWVE